MRYLRLYLSLACLLAAMELTAATVRVSSVSALQSAINNAAAGDHIVVVNGSYTTSASISVTRQGTASQPIVISAETVGGVTITGTNGFTLNSPAAFVTIEGFILTHAAGTTSIDSGATRCRLTRNVFELSGVGPYLSISGDDNEIDHNTFQNKSTLGQMISMAGPNGRMSQRNWIHHNYFHVFTPVSGNGAEIIRVGLSGLSLTDGQTLVEHNLFDQLAGENELISNKSGANTYRFNTIRDSTAQFTLRHGNNCSVHSNFFINTPGIRIFGDNHKIFSNYFESCNPAIQIGNGDTEIPPGILTGHDRPDGVELSFNTLVNNTSNIMMSGRTNGLGATNFLIANNIIQGGGAAVTVSGPFPNPSYEGNILWQATAGIIPASGFRTADPLLVADSNGEFHIQPGSPAIGSSVGSFPLVTIDMDGQPRKSRQDVGADEMSSSPISNRILIPSDVGPNAADLGTGFSVAATPASQTVTAGDQAAYSASVVASPSFADTVTLSVAGLPGGTTASFNPGSTNGSGSSTLTVSTATSTPAGTYGLTLTGAGRSSTQTDRTILSVRSPCATVSAGGAWHDAAFVSKTGSFSTTFDATPSASSINTVAGLSQGPQTAYAGFAVVVRFNPSGDIDARNGGVYDAASIIPYAAGLTYHFRLEVNVAAHTYSIFVTPPGGAELTVGTGFAFRTEQNAVTSLNWWGAFAATGSDTICSFDVP